MSMPSRVNDIPTITRRRHVLACSRCRARRVKCDRVQPACSNCIRAGASCQSVQHTGSNYGSQSSRPSSREQLDTQRLGTFDDDLASSRSPSRERSRSPHAVESIGTSRHYSQGTYVDRNSRYVSPHSWAAAANGIIDLEQILRQGQRGNAQPDSRDASASDLIDIVNDQLHEVLINIFSQQVDPIIRILFWPGFLAASRLYRQQARQQPHTGTNSSYPEPFHEFVGISTTLISPVSIDADPSERFHHDAFIGAGQSLQDPGFLTLLFAVYYAAVTSVLHEDSCMDAGEGVDPADLWVRLRCGLYRRLGALSAKPACMMTISAIQAIVLHLSIELGSSDAQLQYVQLGTAMRMAQMYGLHRDPDRSSFSIIEAEIRRRVWTQMCILDARLAEQLCIEPSIMPKAYDTALPLRLSDAQLAHAHKHNLDSSQMKQLSPWGPGSIEHGLQAASDFSPISLMLVEGEVAKQQQKALSLKHSQQHRTARLAASSAKAPPRSTPTPLRPDYSGSANELRSRLSLHYDPNNLDLSDPLQALVGELCQIAIMKADFVDRLTTHDTSLSSMAPNIQHDHSSLLNDALRITSRCVTIARHYAASPFGWYARRQREHHTSSYLATVVLSEQTAHQSDLNTAWAVLDQLFPIAEPTISPTLGSHNNLLDRVVAIARARRKLPHGHVQQHVMQGMGQQYSLAIPQQPLPSHTSTGTVPSFPASQPFANWDTVMQQSMWPGNIAGIEDNYWV